MPKGNLINMTVEEANEREESRNIIRDLHKAHLEGQVNITVNKKSQDVARIFDAIEDVWSGLVMKPRATMSLADKVYAYVDASDAPVTDMALFMEFRVSTKEARRHLMDKVEAGCVPMFKEHDKDTLFVVACTDSKVSEYEADGYSEVEPLRKKSD